MVEAVDAERAARPRPEPGADNPHRCGEQCRLSIGTGGGMGVTCRCLFDTDRHTMARVREGVAWLVAKAREVKT